MEKLSELLRRAAKLAEELEQPSPEYPPEVVHRHPIFFENVAQLCVPAKWSDGQAVEFARSHGITCNRVAPEGGVVLAGDPARVPCNARKGYCHLVVEHD